MDGTLLTVGAGLPEQKLSRLAAALREEGFSLARLALPSTALLAARDQLGRRPLVVALGSGQALSDREAVVANLPVDRIVVLVWLGPGPPPEVPERGTPFVDLSRWRGARSSAALAEIASKLRSARGRSVGRLIGRFGWRGLLARMSVSGLLIGTAAVSMNLFDLQDQICRVRVTNSISDGCGALGLGGRPTRDERLRFEALPADCKKLAAARSSFKSEAVKEEISQRLTTAREVRDAITVPEERPWNSYVRQPANSFASRQSAEADAKSRALEDAQVQGCTPRTAGERAVSVRLTRIDYTCPPRSDGRNSCGANYSAICEMRVRPLVERCD